MPFEPDDGEPRNGSAQLLGLPAPSSKVCYRGQAGKYMLTSRLTGFDPGCVKTHTSAKCGKYNSPTRYRAVYAQHDLALMMRNFSEMLLHARRAPEFSHGQDPELTPTALGRQPAGGEIAGIPADGPLPIRYPRCAIATRG